MVRPAAFIITIGKRQRHYCDVCVRIEAEAGEHGHFGYWIGRRLRGAAYGIAAADAAGAPWFARTDLPAVSAVHPAPPRQHDHVSSW